MGTYKALLPQHIRFFVFFYSSASVTIVHSILALKSTVATSGALLCKGNAFGVRPQSWSGFLLHSYTGG